MSNQKTDCVWTSKRPDCHYVWALSPGGTAHLLQGGEIVKTPIIAYAEVRPPEIPEYLKPGAKWTTFPPEPGPYWAKNNRYGYVDRVLVRSDNVVMFQDVAYSISSYSQYCPIVPDEFDQSDTSSGGAKQGAQP